MPRSPFQRVERRGLPALDHVPPPHGVDEVAAAGHHAEQGVVVPGEPLGGGVEDEVGAERERLLHERAWRTSSRPP